MPFGTFVVYARKKQISFKFTKKGKKFANQ